MFAVETLRPELNVRLGANSIYIYIYMKGINIKHNRNRKSMLHASHLELWSGNYMKDVYMVFEFVYLQRLYTHESGRSKFVLMSTLYTRARPPETFDLRNHRCILSIITSSQPQRLSHIKQAISPESFYISLHIQTTLRWSNRAQTSRLTTNISLDRIHIPTHI